MVKNSNESKRYTKEFKEKTLERIESSNQSIQKISEDTGVTKSTLYNWIRTKKKQERNYSKPNKQQNKWSSEEKFHMVLETYTLTEEELGAYCRRKGIYIDDIKAWRKQCLKANTGSSPKQDKITKEIKEEKSKTKELEKELRRKEKALAETAALLVLRKKADAIWGDNQED